MIDIKKLKDLSKNLNVLFVDDDFEISQRMNDYLKKFFKNVYIASNGFEAMEYFGKVEVDLVITDISMPKMDGLELLKNIRFIDEEKEVLIVSAFSDFEYLKTAITYGVSGYLLKPLEYDLLNSELYKSVLRINIKKENQQYKEHLQELIKQKEKQFAKNYEATLIALVDVIESRDSYTAGHSQRVAKYSKLIATQMGYDVDDIEMLYQAGLLHDIGKVAVPDSILLNPHKLNDREFKIIQEHVNIGVDILSKIPAFKNIVEIIKYHHERYDGKGYPYGKKADEIPMLSHILIVSDSFDAMTTSRVYKGRKNLQEAFEELKIYKGIQFHPDVVDEAIKALKNIKLSNNIIQEPKNELEKEKFFYFYKDNLTHAFNAKYLDLILKQNIFTKEYKYLYVIYIHNFSSLNKKFGWDEGDKFLKKIVNYLMEKTKDSLVFRIQGDDFVVLTKREIELQNILNQFEYPQKDILQIVYKRYDIDVLKIQSFEEIML